MLRMMGANRSITHVVMSVMGADGLAERVRICYSASGGMHLVSVAINRGTDEWEMARKEHELVKQRER